MGRSFLIFATLLLALVPGCNVEEPDRVVVASAHGSQSSSSGGATVVGVGNGLTVEARAWSFGEPEAFPGRVPPVSLVAVGDAMFRAGPESSVVDALRTERGTVALIREPGGKLFLSHYEGEGCVASPAPAGARRVFPGTTEPFAVRVLVADGLAVTATRIE
ncbi:MAG: hypothetical protein ABFS86_04505 [Planctomycetota bacterium]